MSEWMKTEPLENVLVEVRGSDCMGDWFGVAKKLTYKKLPHKNMKKAWRWVFADGLRYVDQDVDSWRILDD